jgi:predicted site-specific integrase-resolvase
MEVMKPKEFCKRIGISIKTLERIEKRGEITPIWKNKRRYYTDDMVDSYLGIRAEEDDKRINIAYYRVSTNGQKKEMKYQRESIESFSINSGTPIDEYFHDIGSGMNFKRKNFLKIIDMIEKGEVRELNIPLEIKL